MSTNGQQQPESSTPPVELPDGTLELWQEILGEVLAQTQAQIKRDREVYLAQMDTAVAQAGRTAAQLEKEMAAFAATLKGDVDGHVKERLADLGKHVTELYTRMAERLAVLRDGSPGERGADGTIGPAGPQGLQGPKGEKGDQGDQGHQGDLGATGDKGDKGDPGDKGLPGDTGPPGAKGEKGDPGETITGPPGRPGERGAVGDRGRDGAGITLGRGPPLSAAPVGTIYVDSASGDLYVSRYSEDQPRDDDGRWSGGAGGEGDTGGGKEPKEGDGQDKPVAGFSAGVKASNHGPSVQAAKDGWFGASPFKGNIEGAMAASHDTQARLGPVLASIGGKLGIEHADPGVKTDRARIDDKVISRGGAEKVTDLARGSLYITSPKQAAEAAAELGKHFEVAEEPFKVTPAGYADKAIQFRDRNGLVGEVQLLEPKMAEAKTQGHPLYEEQRALKDPEGADKARSHELDAAQQKIYGAVTNGYSKEWRDALGLK